MRPPVGLTVLLALTAFAGMRSLPASYYLAVMRKWLAAALLAFMMALAARGPARAQADDLKALDNQAQQLFQAGKYTEAMPVAERALKLAEHQRGPNDISVGYALNTLGRIYRQNGRFVDAEKSFGRALAIKRKVLGPNHHETLASLENLAETYASEGRYAEAEPLFLSALEALERIFGERDIYTIATMSNLAGLYAGEGRWRDAELLFKRVLTIDQRLYGQTHPEIATDLTRLANTYQVQGRLNEAESMQKQALAIREKVLGPTHTVTTDNVRDLAGIYGLQRRYAESEQMWQRYLTTLEKARGPQHPDLGAGFDGLGSIYYSQGRYAEAISFYKRSLALRKTSLGADHPYVAAELHSLAFIFFSQQDWKSAADYWRASLGVTIRRTQRSADAVGRSPTGKARTEAEQLSFQFRDFVKAAYRLGGEAGAELSLVREAFEMAQWAQSSQTAVSLAQMAARSAKDDLKLAALVRERQDLVAEWQTRDARRTATRSQVPDQRNRPEVAANGSRLAAIDTRITEIDKRLAREFADYAALASPAPVSVEDVQAHLGADEALVLFLDTSVAKPTPEETFLWVVTRSEVRWVRSELGTDSLTREVSALRCGLDYDPAAFLTSGRCLKLLNETYSALDYARGTPLPFDLERSRTLYQQLFGQIEDLIKDKTLLIVPSGALTQLPFQVLVTERPKTALPSSNAGYRDVAWLARSHAIMVLPAVSSLRALRELAKASHASEAYIGFGNPLLDGEPERALDEKLQEEKLAAARLARDKHCAATQALPATTLTDLQDSGRPITRGSGGLVDPASLRKWSPLPETADELCNVARILGADPRTQAHIGADAREQAIKQLSDGGQLAKYRIIHIATHGTLAGQLSAEAEPGLILTPPKQPSEIDDGFLSASEIAGLKLDADWVILSACNTAAGQAEGAEALSGLARAFFYAGSRSLLVSHWYVSSQSVVPLVTAAIAMLAIDPKLGRAEALRRSMLSLIKDGKSYEAHPAFWAPFVLVGEGGAAR